MEKETNHNPITYWPTVRWYGGDQVLSSACVLYEPSVSTEASGKNNTFQSPQGSSFVGVLLSGRWWTVR